MTTLLERPTREEAAVEAPYPLGWGFGILLGLTVGTILGVGAFFLVRPPEPTPEQITSVRYTQMADAMRQRWLDVPANVEALRYAQVADAMRERWLDVPANVEALRYAEYADYMADHYRG